MNTRIHIHRSHQVELVQHHNETQTSKTSRARHAAMLCQVAREATGVRGHPRKQETKQICRY